MRQFVYLGNFEYFENGAGTPEMREVQGSFAIEFQSGDRLTAALSDTTTSSSRGRSTIATGVMVPVGGYDYQSGVVSYLFGQQRKIVRQMLAIRKARFTVGRSAPSSFSGGRFELSLAARDRAERVRELGQPAMGRLHQHRRRPCATPTW